MITRLMMKFKKLVQALGRIRVEHYTTGVLVVGFLIMAFDYVRLHHDMIQLKAQYQESLTLVKQMRAVKYKVATLDRMLAKMSKVSAKLQMIANVKERVYGRRVANNGFEQYENSHIQPAVEKAIIPLKEKIDLRNIEIKVLNLSSDADLQLKKYVELQGFYKENESLLASIPSLLPAKGYIASSFGFRKNPNGRWQMHEGLDIAAYYGKRVIAAADGLVEEAGYAPGYGRYVVIDHGFGLKTRYGHASRVWVKPGDYVKRGKKIASVGRTGRARGTHLHYEVRLNDVPLDPRDFIF